MSKTSISAKNLSRSRTSPLFAVDSDNHKMGTRRIPGERLSAIFMRVGEKLRQGFSGEAEKLLIKTIQSYAHTPDNLANLKRLLAFTLETVGRYKESLDVLTPYETEEILKFLETETQVRVTIQLAICYNNLNDPPKAVSLLKSTLEKAKASQLNHLLGSIDNGLARVYRKLNELPISRDYAEKALVHHRKFGDWLGMADAYREIAVSHHMEGHSEKSLDSYELGIQIIGERAAPFMLGKIYTDMSGAYWFLRRPKDGIECLEKSIEFFNRTEHVLNSVMAYNNLGINLILTGEWTKAESMIKRALDLAVKSDNAHIAGILDSLGELKILRGELGEAKNLLEQAISYARERKREWYEVQAMRNLARCYLAGGDYEKAVEKARDTIDLSREIGDKHYANMAGLVLAESHMMLDQFDECENHLRIIEESDPTSDFFVLGNIQRIRGLAAAENEDAEMAVHFFNRSLTIFEAAGDLYHTALANFLLGSHQPPEQNSRAIKQLTKAGDIFRKLALKPLTDSVEKKIEDLKAASKTGDGSIPNRINSTVSHLLMVRLAEATASRELLFRELIAVLQHESQAKKIIIAQSNDKKKLYPFITHGYTTTESTELVRKFETAIERKEEKMFARVRHLAVFPLRPSNAAHAVLMIHPSQSAILNDGSPMTPLLSVVELGMDVISLRKRDVNTETAVEQQESPSVSNSLMPGFIHSSPGMTALVGEIHKIRTSDVTVLVTGESGTGKELVSKAVHIMSNRKDKIFVPFNCTAIPRDLAEGQLFGYRKGAFTGAFSDSPGIIRSADGGTLFLDEIGDLPLDIQPKLLRFLQEGEIQPIGERRPIKLDVRVVAATNMPLEEKVANGSFREDLYYRLNVIRLRIPPLRERRSEIPALVNYYVSTYTKHFGKHNITFTPQTIDLLMVCNWEGNIRQLCNEIQRILSLAEDNDVITPDHVSPDLNRAARPRSAFAEGGNVVPIASFDSPFTPFSNISEGGTLETAVSELEMQMIKAALARNNWNISRVAAELGLTRRGLYLKLSRYGIEKAA